MHGLTISDSAYLELALRLAVPLASIDKALIFAARAEGVTVLMT
jgi:predicted nucleic acid-binding protein